MPYIKISDEQLDKAVKAVLDSNHTLKQAVQTNLLLEKALDKAVELLDRNMLCKQCPFPKNRERCTVEGCREYLKECLLKDE